MPTPVRPATGVTFSGGGFGTVDNRFNATRTMLNQLLIRDARGSDTNISPHKSDGTVLWTPFATDGQLRGDLFAQIRNASGQWVENTTPNDGWHFLGAFTEGSAPSITQTVDTDDEMIDNQVAVYDSLLTTVKEVVKCTPKEVNKPLIRRLRNHLPLSDSAGRSLVELPGGKDVGWARPLDAANVDRQILHVSSRVQGGKWQHTVKGWSLCVIDTMGEMAPGKKGKAAEMGWKALGGDGFFMAVQDGVYKPIASYEWVSGDGWTALGTPPSKRYTVGVGAATAGTIALTFNPAAGATTGIAFGATAAAVKSALVALDDGYTASDWDVTGTAPTWTVTTPGTYTLTGTATGLTGGTLTITPVS